MEPARFSQLIKSEAIRLGFSSCGMAPISSVPRERLETWLEAGFHGSMGYLERNRSRRLNPAEIVPGAKSVICVTLNYFHPYELPYDDPDLAVFSRYSSGDDYHRVVEERLQLLWRFIEAEGPGGRGWYYVDTGPVLEKYWAWQAGLGWIGKHTNLLSRSAGSWFFLGEIVTDLKLEPDAPARDYCGSCTRCIEACPTDAIVKPYILDARRCISYLTIELREDIPEPFRRAIGNLVFGCDICQDVCPWNNGVPASETDAFRPRPGVQKPSLKSLAVLSQEAFRERFRASPVKRTKWRGLMRNVAVALGNSGNRRFVPCLKDLLNTDDAMVRRHAAWALAELGGEQAQQALVARLEHESDQETVQALQENVARCC